MDHDDAPESSEATACDTCEHEWIAEPSAKASYMRGNAKITRVLRWFLYCQACGAVRYEDDPTAPATPDP
jgi:hypothetical protein